MLTFNLDAVEELQAKNASLTWDGWTLVFHQPHKMGWARKDGEWNRKERKWYTTKRFSVQSDGLYRIPKSVYHGLQH